MHPTSHAQTPTILHTLNWQLQPGLGGLGSSALAFQLPAVLYCVYFWDGTRGRTLTRWEIGACGCIVVFGVFAAIISPFVTSQQLVDGDD